MLVTSIIFALLPVCLFRPWIGVLVWSWIGYMNPHRLTFGFAYNLPFAQLCAVAILVGLVLTKDKKRIPWNRELVLLALLWLTFLVSTLSALYPQDAWTQFEKVSKILLMTFVSLALLQDQRKLKGFIWVIAMSLGYYGLKGGVWSIMTGGQHQVLGPPQSFIEGNTNLGLALNMALPLFILLRREAERPWLKSLLLAIFLFSIVAVIFTYSRGAFLGLAVVVVSLSLRSKMKIPVILLLVVAAYLAPMVLPEKWFGRMETIQTYEQDQSAMGRIRAWKVSYRLALDHPVLGGGFETYSNDTYRKYLPDDMMWSADMGTGAHSIFLQVLGEHGFTGLSLFVLLIAATWLSLGRLIRQAAARVETEWIRNYAEMLRVSLLGYVVSGLFLSMCYFDLFYHLVAMVAILKQLMKAHSLDGAGGTPRQDWGVGGKLLTNVAG
ncbi:MAG: putative O-glycosylation ligase, exosortase A system-associated [Acidobacteriota bacterium]